MHLMGPVLIFRGSHSGSWRLSALVTTADAREPPPLSTGAGAVRPRALFRRRQDVLWRYDFAFPLEQAACDREYSVGDRTWRVRVPAETGALRLAFTACNGSEHGDAWKDPNARNALWLDLARKHAG